MKKIIVIGSGPGGYVAAIRAAQMGAKVCLVEKDKLGGTCLNYGCIPTKSLISSCSLFNKVKKASEFGIEVEGIRVHMDKIMQRKQRIVSVLRNGVGNLIKRNKIELIKGIGRLKNEKEVIVETGNGEIEIKGDYIILATGSIPRSLKGIGFDGETILSSDHLLNLQDIPQSMVIIGGGVIGCEFAYILNSLGCKVYILEAMNRLLPVPGIDLGCSNVIQREMKKMKVGFQLNAFVNQVKRLEDGMLEVIYKTRTSDDNKSIKTNKVAVCVGREPVDLEYFPGLEVTGQGWVRVDEYLRTSVPNIYAIGDILGPSRPMLAHVASHEAVVAVSNIFGNKKKMDYSLVPGVVYTKPEIGCVGITEHMARDMGIEYGVSRVMFPSIGRSHTEGEISGEAKILFDKKDKKVLGIHIIGPHASELIATGCVLIRQGATMEDIGDTIFAHPTLSEIFHEMAMKGIGYPIHG